MIPITRTAALCYSLSFADWLVQTVQWTVFTAINYKSNFLTNFKFGFNTNGNWLSFAFVVVGVSVTVSWHEGFNDGTCGKHSSIRKTLCWTFYWTIESLLLAQNLSQSRSSSLFIQKTHWFESEFWNGHVTLSCSLWIASDRLHTWISESDL